MASGTSVCTYAVRYIEPSPLRLLEPGVLRDSATMMPTAAVITSPGTLSRVRSDIAASLQRSARKDEERLAALLADLVGPLPCRATPRRA